MYIVSGAFARGWRNGPGVADVFANRQTFAAALAAADADIKRLGFNTVILDPGFYDNPAFGYGAYAQIAARQAARDRIGLVIGLPVTCPAEAPRCWDDPHARNDAYLASCQAGPDQRAFVDRFAAAPAVKGFLCAYENFGQPNATPSALAAVKALTRYIEDKGRFFFDIPAAGRQDRVEGVFSLMTPQLNPRLYATPALMRAELRADNARYGGSEINFWHRDAVPENGYPAGVSGTEKWHQLQYDAFIRLRPRNITVFDYQKLIAARDGELLFYRPRGWLMSLMARLNDPGLVFYDPLEAEFSSRVMHAEPVKLDYRHDGADALLGRGVDGGTAAVGRDGALLVPLIVPEQGPAPLFSVDAGTFTAWIKADWASGADARHGLLQTPCLAGLGCLVLEIGGGEFRFALTDSTGVRLAAAAPLAGWRRRAWNHLAASWDRVRGKVVLYCNGRPAAILSSGWRSGAVPQSAAAARLVVGSLGNGKPDGEHGLDGELDEVRLFTRALSADEIGALYQNFAVPHRAGEERGTGP
jgi:hypothetical protein